MTQYLTFENPGFIVSVSSSLTAPTASLVVAPNNASSDANGANDASGSSQMEMAGAPPRGQRPPPRGQTPQNRPDRNRGDWNRIDRDWNRRDWNWNDHNKWNWNWDWRDRDRHGFNYGYRHYSFSDRPQYIPYPIPIVPTAPIESNLRIIGETCRNGTNTFGDCRECIQNNVPQSVSYDLITRYC